ncbi:MAG: glycoside hydrolase family 88 protein [Acidobacteriota bacterium]
MKLAFAVAVSLLPLAAQETRVIGYAQDGKTVIQAQIAAGYRGVGGTLAIAGLEGIEARSKSSADVTITLANPLKATLQFPPTGVPYREHAESWVLWRWIELHAPRQIVFAGDAGGLREALGKLMSSEEVARRQARTPQQFAAELAKFYGHDFNQVTYLPGMALISQMRLGNTDEVAKLAEPYLQPGKDPLARASSLTLAGHMVFAELAKRTKDPRYVALVKKVGELGFDESGAMRESMPLHGEMSDSYFMAGPITATAGTLTGDQKYFPMVARHFHFMDKLVLRSDGLYRHSPLVDTAWGRGNAFAALGMALALSEFPKDQADRGYIVESVRRQMSMLARFQDADGMWHNIIDEPGSYPETSATAMIATAMLRGIHDGWLPAAEYQPRVDRAWKAVLARTASDGTILDVCESTNKQATREDYLHRAALTGKDERGGGMLLLFATEMMGLR